MTIAEKLQKIREIKENIRLAIIDKGVAVSPVTPFEEYVDRIELIEGGGSKKEKDNLNIQKIQVLNIYYQGSLDIEIKED